MDINVYFDCDGTFLSHLIGGNQSGFDIRKWMMKLYQSKKQGDNYLPDTNLVKESKFPCVIVLFKSLFDIWYQDLERRINKLKQCPTLTPEKQDELKSLLKWLKVVCNHQNSLEQHLQQQCSFLNNSSIWIRLVDWKQYEITDAVNEMLYFSNIGLYDYDSAKENLEYNLRIQKENYLNSLSNGHGEYVTPMLYGNEVEHWNILFKDNKIEKK